MQANKGMVVSSDCGGCMSVYKRKETKSMVVGKVESM